MEAGDGGGDKGRDSTVWATDSSRHNKASFPKAFLKLSFPSLRSHISLDLILSLLDPM